MKLIPAFIVMASLIAACSSAPSENAIQTAIAKTQIAVAQLATNTPTITLSPTLTNTPTSTSTATFTPTSTSTPTLPPETQTAIANATKSAQATQSLGATQTEVVAQATARQVVIYRGLTETAAPIIATQTKLAANITETASAYAATQSFFAQHKQIDLRELVNYADQHKGEKVMVSGRVFNVLDSTTFQMWLGGGYDAAIIDTIVPLSGIYKDSFVVVYGTVGGYLTGTNSYGGTIKQPAIVNSFVVKQ